MPTISGINVRELNVKINGNNPIISVKYDPSLPTLIDVTASVASGHTFGRAIINDNDSTNNIIEIANFEDYIGQIIWLRVVVHHPALNKYKFIIPVEQDSANLTTFEENGDLNQSTFFYEGFILREA